MNSALRSGRTTAALIALFLGATATTAEGAVELLPSRFYESITSSFANSSGDETTPENLPLLSTVDEIGTLTGFSSTRGGPRPRADVEFAMAVVPGTTLYLPWVVSSSAEIRYYWAIEQVGGIPWGETVPVDIETRAQVQFAVDSTNGPGLQHLYATAFFDTAADSNLTFTVAPCSGVPDCIPDTYGFHENFKVNATPNLANRIQLTSLVWFSLADGSMSASAWVDPIIQISPDFERRDDFRVVFGSYVTPVPVPPTALLLVGALLSMVRLHGRRGDIHSGARQTRIGSSRMRLPVSV